MAQIYGDRLRQYLADRGWYIAGTLYPGQMAKLSQAIEQNSENEIEEFLKEHVRRLMSEVEKDICQAWPIRAPLLKDAFEAHKSKKYALSIPVLLAQADGICYDSIKSFLFTKPNETSLGTLRRLVHKAFSQSSGTFQIPLPLKKHSQPVATWLQCNHVRNTQNRHLRPMA